jgi:hypothetical protein
MKIRETGKKPTEGNKSYICYLVEYIEIDEALSEMKVKIRNDSYVSFVNRLERIIDASGIDGTEELTFSCMPNFNEREFDIRNKESY